MAHLPPEPLVRNNAAIIPARLVKKMNIDPSFSVMLAKAGIQGAVLRMLAWTPALRVYEQIRHWLDHSRTIRPCRACEERVGVRHPTIVQPLAVAKRALAHHPESVRKHADSDLSPQAGQGDWALSQFFHTLFRGGDDTAVSSTDRNIGS
jgi:hypothetical protein